MQLVSVSSQNSSAAMLVFFDFSILNSKQWVALFSLWFNEYVIIGPKVYKDIEAQRYNGNSRLTSLGNEEIRPAAKQREHRISVFPNSVPSLFFTAPLLLCKVKGRIIIYPLLGHEVTGEVQLHVFFNLDARQRRWSAPSPSRFIPWKTNPVPQV